jgi:hypothetical protein
MHRDLRSYCPLLTAADRPAPGVRGPMAAQTGQHNGAATWGLALVTTGLVGKPEGARQPSHELGKLGRAARHRPAAQPSRANG